MPNDKDFELDDLEAFSFDDLSLDEAGSPDGSGEDPYGVWVKSAPEDRVSADPEPGLTDLPEALSEDDFLSSQELADLDESFDFVAVEEPLDGDTPPEADASFLDTPPEGASVAQGPVFDEVSLDDFVSFDDVGVEDRVPGADLTVDGDLAAEEAGEEFLDIDIDIEDDIQDEELEIIEGARLPAAADGVEAVPTDQFLAQEVDLSEFGDFEEVIPESPDPLAAEEDLPEVAEVPSLDDLPSLDDITLADDLPGFTDDGGFFEEQVLEEVLPNLEPDDQTDLDQLKALEETLTSGIREAEPVPAVPAVPVAPPAAETDLAALLLSKLEQELSSIKREISDLKKEVIGLRSVPEAPVRPEEKESHGFFDEEDDETIALTGDELDNLLSTAEISEGEERGVSLDEDLLPLSPEGLEEVHVTDEEFLAGTPLDPNEPDAFEGFGPAEEIGGIPESIELEEDFPLDLDAGETEDLLSGEDTLDIDPLPEGVLEGRPSPLEIPFDDDLSLELAEAAPLAPELDDNFTFDPLPPLEELDALTPGDPDGWSLPPEPPVSVTPLSEPLPDLEPTPAPPVPQGPLATGSLSPGLKDELRAVLSYMDKLLASLPDDKIQEFAESEHFEVYKRLFEELGLIE